MIRIAREADVPRMLAIYAPYILNTTYTFEYTVPTQEEFLARFRDITAQFPWLVWEEEGTVLGYVYGSAPYTRAAYRWCGELSIYLVPEARGKGIGRQLYLAAEEILRRQGYQVCYPIITAENTGSICFHERMGYTFSAHFPACGFKFGRWLGVTWMEKRLNFVDSVSNFQTSWLSIVDNDRIGDNILADLSLS